MVFKRGFFMMETFPSIDVIEELEQATPDYMHPNHQPWLVVSKGHLPVDVCDKIVEAIMSELPYRFPHCKADTRECPRPLNSVMDPIAEFVLHANDTYWEYDLNDDPAAWMQTYREDDSYAKHMDASIGQTRKLTAIAMLTDENKYWGGELVMHIPPQTFIVPKEKGTIVVFPHWMMHEVLEVQLGIRQTINLGFWGPAFR